MTPREFCRRHGACFDGVKFALKFPTMSEVWDACGRIDWLFWLISRTDMRLTPVQLNALRRFALYIMRETPLPDGRILWNILNEAQRDAVHLATWYIDESPDIPASLSEVSEARNRVYDDLKDAVSDELIHKAHAVTSSTASAIHSSAASVINDASDTVAEVLSILPVSAYEETHGYLLERLKMTFGNPFADADGKDGVQ
jgi:hypothetical protein